MLGVARKAALQPTTIVSPTGGINSVSPLSAMGPQDAVTEVNMLPGAEGAAVRLGSVVHTAAVGSSTGVRTIIPFTGVDGTHDKLFATTNAGIYDCTVSGASPVLLLGFTTTTGLAGYGNSTNFSTLADHYAIYCDEVNGYYLYTEGSGTWQKVVEGVDATSIFTPPTSSTATAVINGVSFTATFATNPDTTVNNLIALIEADPATIALVQVKLVAHQMVVEALAQGTGGNGITTTSNNANGASFNLPATAGGVDGIYGIPDPTTGIPGPPVDPSTFVFCTPFQSRLWFCQRNSSIGYYLEFNSIFGTASPFNFGANQAAGGSLKCMSNWTVDSGNGVGNNLAVLSEAGDISVYQGNDPDTAGAFNLVGVWYVGGFPVGRNITTDDGGDVLIVTSLGVISLSQYLQGLSLADRSLYATRKIANLIAQEVAENSNLQGWQLIVTPDEQAVLLAVPQQDLSVHMYAMPYATRNWSVLSGRNANCMAVFLNKLYFGTNVASSNLYEVTGNLDFVQLDGSGGQPIAFTVFGSFQGLGAPAVKKRVQMARVSFVTSTSPVNFSLAARFDYDTTPAPPAPVPMPPSGGSLWDSAVWDVSVWDAGGTAQATASFETMVGLAGEGRMVAMALNGYATESTVLQSITVLYESAQSSMGFF